MKKRICLNEDNGHFYSTRSPDELSEETISALVDTYTQDTQVGRILFCVNVKRALFDSETWDPIFKGYDPDGPDDQEMLQWLEPDARRLDGCNQGRRQIHTIWLMARKGLDHFAIWLDRCRQNGVEGWLSVRMNDCHYVNNERSHWHSDFWKENPDCRIVTYRDPADWAEYGLDFSHEKVRRYYLRFIRELFERYDMDGLELDWMRFGLCLPYGSARPGSGLITEFIEEVGALSKICSKRTGREVRIGVRVPPEIQTCLSLGYDVIEWIQREMVRQITISNFLSDHWLDFPVETWKAIIGQRPIDLAVCLHAGITDPNNFQKWILDNADIYRGSAGAALVKGADRIYLFNTCYYERDMNHHRDVMLKEILTSCGAIGTIAEKPRRHILTFKQFLAPGEPEMRKIPTALKKEGILFLRFNIGPAPQSGQEGIIHLGFGLDKTDADSIDELRSASLWVNGKQCEPVEMATPPCVTETANFFIAWAAPQGSLQTGENVVEYLASALDGKIVWAEIMIS